MSLKKLSMEKNFKIDIFVLKYILDHPKSIPNKKLFSKNFRFFGHFLGPKFVFFNWGEGKEILKVLFPHFKRIALRSCCAIARLPTSIELGRLTRFIKFLTKNSQK